jgi:taurine dioxygenase
MVSGRMHLAAEPITPIVGAEVRELDLTAPLTDRIMASLRDLLLIHGILVFRGQDAMTREHLVALARALGPVERSPIGEASHPEVVRIVHDADAPPTENIWHVDHSFRPAPPLGAVLRAIEVPSAGGDTLFADLRAVWRRIPHNVQAVVRDLCAKHDIAKWAPADRVTELQAAAPVIVHPAVRIHPETHQEILFVNAAYTTSFVGLEASDSVALLDFLLRQVHVPEVQCRVRWRPGTVVVWDNRSVQHYAVGDYLPKRRVMERVTIGGDRVLGPEPSTGKRGETIG